MALRERTILSHAGQYFSKKDKPKWLVDAFGLDAKPSYTDEPADTETQQVTQPTDTLYHEFQQP